MTCLLGIDLGTSSVKSLVLDTKGKIQSQAIQNYPILSPKAGYAEQDPETWWSAAARTLNTSVTELGKIRNEIACIGLSGQMHGLVCLDENLNPLRPAIIHADQRSGKQIEQIYEIVGKEDFCRCTLNVLYPGFLLPSLLWVKENEPDIYRATQTVLLPKDYIRYRLTGTIGTDYSDASGSLAFDTGRREWAYDIIKELDLDPALFPPCGETAGIAGYVTSEAARQTGLAAGTPMIFGGSDQPMQALGNGVIGEGEVTSTIGTSGQVYTPAGHPVYDPDGRIHTFCSCIPDSWYNMGAMMSAGLSLQWLKNSILDISDNNTLNEEAGSVPPGCDGVIFLPYLIGERTPHLNPNARGMFFGLKASHTRGHLIRSVMEGVAFGLKDSLEIIKDLGADIFKVIASGGGAQSPLWLQVQADIYGHEIYFNTMSEQACLGAAIAAGVGCGMYSSFTNSSKSVINISDDPIKPIEENRFIYEKQYDLFQSIYTRVHTLY